MVRRTKAQANATRNQLLDAAEQVFHAKGVSRATLSDIALAAGTTRGAIYWHFKDKSDLFDAMMARVRLPLEGAYNDAERAPGPPLQRLRNQVAQALQALAGDERMRRVFEVAFHKVEYVDELVAVRTRRIAIVTQSQQQLVQDLTQAAQQLDVRLPTSAQVATRGIRALIDGLIERWLLGGGDFDLAREGVQALDTYLAGLGFGQSLG